MGKINTITYSLSRTHRLPTPYDTNCKVYELDNRGVNDMRSDCVQKCIDNRLQKLFPELKCVFTLKNYKLIRKNNLDNLAQYPFCNYYKFSDEYLANVVRRQFKEDQLCRDMCLRNCNDLFYQFDVDIIKAHSWINQSNEFLVTIEHNRFPDQIITHKPVMSWIELMSNFGGLLGMWLGLSIMFVLKAIIKLM